MDSCTSNLIQFNALYETLTAECLDENPPPTSKIYELLDLTCDLSDEQKNVCLEKLNIFGLIYREAKEARKRHFYNPCSLKCAVSKREERTHLFSLSPVKKPAIFEEIEQKLQAVYDEETIPSEAEIRLLFNDLVVAKYNEERLSLNESFVKASETLSTFYCMLNIEVPMDLIEFSFSAKPINIEIPPDQRLIHYQGWTAIKAAMYEVLIASDVRANPEKIHILHDAVTRFFHEITTTQSPKQRIEIEECLAHYIHANLSKLSERLEHKPFQPRDQLGRSLVLLKGIYPANELPSLCLDLLVFVLFPRGFTNIDITFFIFKTIDDACASVESGISDLNQAALDTLLHHLYQSWIFYQSQSEEIPLMQFCASTEKLIQLYRINGSTCPAELFKLDDMLKTLLAADN